ELAAIVKGILRVLTAKGGSLVDNQGSALSGSIQGQGGPPFISRSIRSAMPRSAPMRSYRPGCQAHDRSCNLSKPRHESTGGLYLTRQNHRISAPFSAR